MDKRDTSSKASLTRERILDQAERQILRNGFSATNIEDILQQAAITKSGFFYHFASKNDLAKALVERYLKEDEKLFTTLWERADSLSEDPLQRLLLFLKLFAETMQTMEHAHPGCLVVTFTYESYQQDDELRKSVLGGVLAWRGMLLERLDEINRRTPIPAEVPAQHLADMFTAAVEGGILLSRIFGSNDNLVQQILLYRDYVRRLFGAT